MDVFTNIMVTILQYRCVSNHHVVYTLKIYNVISQLYLKELEGEKRDGIRTGTQVS